ncbi:hypothetical protein CVD19_23630 [Bacillus sp. T33-2]|nr:hypothetical protein CVD19_23630 [Bacillus sp. T33-2]
MDRAFIKKAPSFALGQAKEEVLRMGKLALQGMEESYQFLKTKNYKHSSAALHLEESINDLDRKITDYLIELSSSSLTGHEAEEHLMLLDTVRDIERIGDHFENIVELADYQLSNKIKLSGLAMQDLESMFSLTFLTVKEALYALDHQDMQTAKNVVEKEEEIDEMERRLRKQQILRMNDGSCTGHAGIVFVDIVSNLERIGDHAVNIAEAVLGSGNSRQNMYRNLL